MNVLPAFLKAYSDSSFTNPHEVVRPDDPPDCKGQFTHMGAKYWGFETLRHTTTSVDAATRRLRYDDNNCQWFQVGLTHRSAVSHISVSTRWFTGNQVPVVSLTLIDRTTGKEQVVVSRAELAPDMEHHFDITDVDATDCLVTCFHEGGIARVNLFGEAGAPLYERKNLLEDASISHTTNEHYGKPADAVKGNRDVDYMLGWESARTGFGESCIFTLPTPAVVETIIVDTYLHRLNPPLSCHVFGANLGFGELADAAANLPRWKLVFPNGEEVIPDNFRDYMLNREFVRTGSKFDIVLHHDPPSQWAPLVAFAELHPDRWHELDMIETPDPINTIYYMHYPNGGIHGLKVWQAR